MKKEIGDFDKRVTVERATSTRSEAGQPIKSWDALATRWADIRSLSTREYLQAEQINAEISHEVWFRYPLDVTSKDRLIYKDRIFEISSVQNIDEDKRYIKALCKERV